MVACSPAPTRMEQVKGLLNGIDTAVWDPSRDTVLPAQYSPLHAAPKALCKKFVMKV